jgi:hypothetical protein
MVIGRATVSRELNEKPSAPFDSPTDRNRDA